MNVKAEVGRFVQFMSRGSVIDLAIGTVIGGAFGAVVTTFVKDILSPLLDLISTKSLENGFFTLRKGPNAPYGTKEEGQKDGAVVMGCGAFVQAIINFIIQGFAIFLFVRTVSVAKNAASGTLKSIT